MATSRPFFQAVQIMTIVPTPAETRIDGDWLQSAKYFPLVGALIGTACATALLIADLFWSGAVPAIIAVGVGVALTGGIHEDGVSDTADGLFGGRSREQRLTIIKDSRIGTYGALALAFSLALRIALLASLPVPIAAAALVAAHSIGRAGVTAGMTLLPYGGNLDTAKLDYPQQRLSFAGVVITLAFTMLGFGALFALAPWSALLGAVLAVLLAALPILAARRLLGGYTGDILGAAEQMAEVGLLLGVAALI